MKQFDDEAVLRLVIREMEESLRPELESDKARSSLMMIETLLARLVVQRTASAFFDRFAELGQEVRSLPASSAKALATLMRQEVETLEAIASRTPGIGTSSAAAKAMPTAERLTAHLRGRGWLAPDDAVLSVSQLFGGLSKQTFMAELRRGGNTESLVLRCDADYGPVARSVTQEFPFLERLHAAGLPVIEPVLLEADDSAFGAPFLLTRRVGGVTVSNVWGMTVGAGHVAAARGLAAFLGQLHALDPADHFPPAMLAGRSNVCDCILLEIDEYERVWIDNHDHASATLTAAFAWLRANLPDAHTERPRVVHGDAGLHNLMMDGSTVTAMLDWELTHFGDPAEDLSYCRTWIDQVLPWHEFEEIYRLHGGGTHAAERENYYGLLADLRVAVCTVRGENHLARSRQPDLAIAYGASQYHSVFVRKVAERLQRLTATDPGASR